VQPVYFPNYRPGYRPFGAAARNNDRDYSDNGVALAKLQYQRNFNAASYLRLYGYTEYSNWFIGGPANAQFANFYGAELNDYELPSHTFGFNANYSSQLSEKHLLSLTGSYTAAQVRRQFSYGFPGNTPGYAFTNLVDARGNCYDATTATVASCVASIARRVSRDAARQPRGRLRTADRHGRGDGARRHVRDRAVAGNRCGLRQHAPQ